MRHRPIGLGVCLLGLVLAGAPRAAGPEAADEKLLRDSQVPTDGPGLLEYFRQRTANASDKARIKGLIRDLGDDEFEKREQASRVLVAFGSRSREALQQADNDPDPEVAHRARECLRRIEGGGAAAVAAAAARVLAARKPDGAVEVLLNYLPSADDEAVAEEVRLALGALAVRDGKPDPTLVAALADKQAARRAAAVTALGRAGTPEILAELRKLIRDPDLSVRFRVVASLAALRDKDAVSHFIDLLDQPLPGLERSRAEEFLYRLAQDKAPPPLTGPDDDNARKKYAQSWRDWQRQHGARVDTAKAEEIARTLGYTLALMLDRGELAILDGSNRVLFKVEHLDFPLDAQWLPGDHVLVAEHNGNRVTERNRKGEVVWERKIESPLVSQRLPNGNTFIAGRAQLVEVDPTGKEVFNHVLAGGEQVMKAQKLADGNYAVIGMQGNTRFLLLDKTGKELRAFPVNVATSGGRIDVQADGHVVVPEAYNNRVVEYDPQGRAVWEATTDSPIAAVRLANGNTLVTSMTMHPAIELDRKGKTVWSYKTDTRINRIFRR